MSTTISGPLTDVTYGRRTSSRGHEISCASGQSCGRPSPRSCLRRRNRIQTRVGSGYRARPRHRAFISHERLALSDQPRGYRQGASDLAVEVLSPGDRLNKVEAKVAQWLETGASMVWVVSPKRRTITVHRSATEIFVLTEKDTLDGAEVFQDFKSRWPIYFKAGD